jgi:hypothetical protein
VLPAEEMAALLAQELQRRGYQRDGDVLARTTDGVTISVDVAAGAVTVAAQSCAEVELQGEREGRAYDDEGRSAKQVREELGRQLQSDLDKRAADQEAALQTEVTDRLEGKLSDLRQELDEVSNRVTAEALKNRAAQLGRIKEISEDAQAGSLTIVLEV